MNPYCEQEYLTEMSDWVSVSNGLLEIAAFRIIKEHEFFGDQGGYPAIFEVCDFIHEGRRMIPEIHGEDIAEQLYHLDGCVTLGFEEG
jgi:hypothetical protein